MQRDIPSAARSALVSTLAATAARLVAGVDESQPDAQPGAHKGPRLRSRSERRRSQMRTPSTPKNPRSSRSRSSRRRVKKTRRARSSEDERNSPKDAIYCPGCQEVVSPLDEVVLSNSKNTWHKVCYKNMNIKPWADDCELGECPGCGNEVKKGEPIHKSASKKHWHQKCWEEAHGPAAAGAGEVEEYDDAAPCICPHCQKQITREEWMSSKRSRSGKSWIHAACKKTPK